MKNSTLTFLVGNMFMAATLVSERETGFLILLMIFWLCMYLYFLYKGD